MFCGTVEFADGQDLKTLLEPRSLTCHKPPFDIEIVLPVGGHYNVSQGAAIISYITRVNSVSRIGKANMRFSIPSIRNDIAKKKEEEKNIQEAEALKAKHIKDEKRIETQKKRQAQQLFFNHYGRQILEAAAQGHSFIEITDISASILDLPSKLLDRGFVVDVIRLNEFSELSNIDQDLFLKFNSRNSAWASEVFDIFVSWGSYPSERDDGLVDCLNAKYLDWLSDEYGSEFIAGIFTRIEEIDLSGGKKISIECKSAKIRNEYTNDLQKKGYRIFGTDFPFELEQFISFFSIMGYEVNLRESAPPVVEVSWS